MKGKKDLYKGKTCKELHELVFGENRETNPVTRSVYLEILANRSIDLESKVEELRYKLEEKLSEIQRLKAENAKLKSDYKEIQEERDQLQSAVFNLRKAIDEEFYQAELVHGDNKPKWILNLKKAAEESRIQKKKFQIKSLDIHGEGSFFTEDTAPSYLRFGGRKGSTMDNRWFWDEHVMKLEVGQSVCTDFSRITRVE